jgi:uncharacterized protein YgiB involved in biofilm formation
MKRSSRISLVLLSSMSALAVSGCEAPEPTKPDTGGTFANKAECVAVYDKETCDAAEKIARSEHLKNAPQTTREQCIAEYGADMCRPASEYGGSSNMFMPLMIGYMMGSMNSTPAPLYYGPGSYRERDRRNYQAPIYSSGSGYRNAGAIGKAAYIPRTTVKTSKGSLKSTTSLTPPATQRGVFGSSFKPTTNFKSSYSARNPSSFGSSSSSYASRSPASSISSGRSYSSGSVSRGVFGGSGRSFGGGFGG